ncbi:universal stress protein [Ramlibacter sp. MAHUQ-53]|uniref:universal stress protein n=1 Tax=unclassified Ramlibacter TaxID=2617605 RepID=UPI00363CBFCF
MFKRILLATDGSAASDHAATLAISLARTHGATLTALYVVDPYPYLGIGEANPMGFNAYMEAARVHGAEAHARVARMSAEGGAPVPLVTRLVEDVSVIEGLLETARDTQADLIVIGSHGRTGIARVVLGSVAAKVVAQSPVPVLVTR